MSGTLSIVLLVFGTICRPNFPFAEPGAHSFPLLSHLPLRRYFDLWRSAKANRFNASWAVFALCRYFGQHGYFSLSCFNFLDCRSHHMQCPSDKYSITTCPSRGPILTAVMSLMKGFEQINSEYSLFQYSAL